MFLTHVNGVTVTNTLKKKQIKGKQQFHALCIIRSEKYDFEFRKAYFFRRDDAQRANCFILLSCIF